MKKLATLAVLAMLAGSASAASITWGFGGQVYVSKDGSSAVLGTSFTDTVPWSLALVYVGQGKNTFDIGSLTEASVVDSVTYGISTSGKTAGKWNPANKTKDTTAYADGASFAVVLFDTAAKTFDYIYAGTTSVGNAVKSTTTISDMSARGSGTVWGAGSASGTGVVVVPEPSTAVLALAGLALLLKRRKA